MKKDMNSDIRKEKSRGSRRLGIKEAPWVEYAAHYTAHYLYELKGQRKRQTIDYIREWSLGLHR